MDVLGGGDELPSTRHRDLGSLVRSGTVHAQHLRRAEVAAAVVREDLVPNGDLLDRSGGPIGHRHQGVGDEALIRVADDHDVAVLFREQADELPLRQVGVLELVDEDVGEAVTPAGQGVGVLPEEANDEQQEVVEVGRRSVAEALLVLDVDVGEPLLGLGARRRERLLGSDELVLHGGDRGVQTAGRIPLRVQVHVAAHVVHEAGRVGLVVDRERRAVAEQPGFAPEDPRARRVERRHPHLVRHRTDERRHPLLHLPRGLVGERDGEDPERRHATLGDEVRDAVGEETGLPRPGTRDDEDRPVGRDHRLALDRVQTLEEIVCDLPERVEIRPALDVRSALHGSIVQVFARGGRVASFHGAAGARPETAADRSRSGNRQGKSPGGMRSSVVVTSSDRRASTPAPGSSRNARSRRVPSSFSVTVNAPLASSSSSAKYCSQSASSAGASGSASRGNRRNRFRSVSKSQMLWDDSMRSRA